MEVKITGQYSGTTTYKDAISPLFPVFPQPLAM